MKKNLPFFMLVAILSMSWLTSVAQTRILTGNVRKASGDPIAGASIAVKGTTTGTVSDDKGNFSLALPGNSNTLVFSAVGFKMMEMEVGPSNVVNVTMEEDVLGVDQVVVTALGIPSDKKSLGYSAQQIDGDKMNQSGTGNALSELSGKVAGLDVINSSGTPGAGTYLRLRGVTSLTGNNQPLIIVDGIPIDNSTNAYDPTNAGSLAGGPAGNATGGVEASNRGIDINPNDIQSVTVLKGPAATALYGIEAASGAILITTKKGDGGGAGGVHVSFNTSESWDMVNKLPDLQNKYAQGTGIDPNTGDALSSPVWIGADGLGGDSTVLLDQFSLNMGSGRKFSWGPAIDTLYWTGKGLPNYDTHGRIVGAHDPSAKTPVTPYDNYSNFFRTGMTADNNISLSGGKGGSSYRVSIGDTKQTGVIPKTGANKTSFSLAGQTALTSKLSTSGSVTYVNNTRTSPQQGSNVSGIMLGLLRTPPTFDNSYGLGQEGADSTAAFALPDGTPRNYRGGAGYDNPNWVVNRIPYGEEVNRVMGYGEVDYQVLNWMKVTYRVGGDVYGQNQKTSYDINSNAFPAGLIVVNNIINRQFNSDLILNMDHKFSKSMKGNLLLGHNYFTNSSTTDLIYASSLVIPEFYDLANATSYFSSEAEGKKRTQAFYGQTQMNYMDYLYLTLTGRKETTSTLSAGKNGFFYPSAGLAFVFTEPLKMATNKIFPYGKLHLNYAQVGKDAPIQALQTYNVPIDITDGFTTGVQFPFNGLPGYGINSTSVIGNPDLKPERTNSFEGGLDLIFVQNRISFSWTYYNEKTTDEIYTVPIAPSTGYAAAILNAGTITNSGMEITLNLTPVKLKNGLRWDLSFNWNHNKNVVNKLADGVDNLFIAGFENGAIYAVAGQSAGEIYGSAYLRDSDGNIVINDDKTDPGYGAPIVDTKNHSLGSIFPKWTGSINSDLTYKGFTFGFQIDIRHGGMIWNGTAGALGYFGTSKATENRDDSTTFNTGIYANSVLGHVDQDGNIVHSTSDTTTASGTGGANHIVRHTDQYYWQNIGSSFIGPAEANVENGSFVRIRQISLTYTFPAKCAAKLHLGSLALTVFANNPALWTKYTGVDPETSLVGPVNGQGLDYFNNPGIKSYGLRLNLGL